MAHVRKNPTQFSKRDQWFYQKMDLANMLENDTYATSSTAPASTGRSKKGTTVRKGEGTKKGRSAGCIVEESHKGTTAQYGESYMGITRSPLPQHQANLPLPLFGGNFFGDFA